MALAGAEAMACCSFAEGFLPVGVCFRKGGLAVCCSGGGPGKVLLKLPGGLRVGDSWHVGERA